MAKDKKSKKADLPDGFAKPSEAPAGGDGFRAEHEDNVGKLLLITPLRVQTVKGFEGADAEVVVADVVVLNKKNPEKSAEHEEVFFFGGWTKGALRSYIGERRVLGYMGQDKSKGRGKNAAWVLDDAKKGDEEIARAYIAGLDPFAQKGAKKGKATDEKSSKKSKAAPEPAKGKGKKKK